VILASGREPLKGHGLLGGAGAGAVPAAAPVPELALKPPPAPARESWRGRGQH
jgi:hypothetical protein